LVVESVVADRLDVLLRHDLAAVEGQPRGQQRVGLLGVDDERVRIGRLDAVDRGERRGDHRLDGGIVRALDAELRVRGGERIAVVELDPLAELEPPGRLPLELPLGCQPGWSLPSGWRPVRLSNRLKETRMSLDDVL